MIREAIKQALEVRGISQAQCSVDNEIAYQNLSAFLRGKRPLPIRDIERIFDYLGIELVVRKKKR